MLCKDLKLSCKGMLVPPFLFMDTLLVIAYGCKKMQETCMQSVGSICKLHFSKLSMQ